MRRDAVRDRGMIGSRSTMSVGTPAARYSRSDAHALAVYVDHRPQRGVRLRPFAFAVGLAKALGPAFDVDLFHARERE